MGELVNPVANSRRVASSPPGLRSSYLLSPMTVRGLGSVSSPIVISDDEDAFYVEQHLDGDSWMDSSEASNQFMEMPSELSVGLSSGQKRKWHEMVALGSGVALPERVRATPIIPIAGPSIGVSLTQEKATTVRNKRRKKQKLESQSDSPVPVASAQVPQYTGSQALPPLCFAVPSPSTLSFPRLALQVPTLPPKPSSFTTSLGHSLNTPVAPPPFPAVHEESVTPAPPTLVNANTSVIPFPSARRIIGMPADDKPANINRGIFASLIKNSASPDVSRALVMELLPRKFREFGFVQSWAKQFDQCPIRVELDNRVGKALIEFRNAEAAMAAFNSPRLDGGEGKEHVRVWWYRLDLDAPTKDLEEGEIQEVDRNDHGFAQKKKPKAKQQKTQKKKMQDTTFRSKFAAVSLPPTLPLLPPLPPPLPRPSHAPPPLPQVAHSSMQWENTSQPSSTSSFPLTGFIPPPSSWAERYPATWQDWPPAGSRGVPRSWPGIHPSTSLTVEQDLPLPPPLYEESVEEEPMDLGTDDGYDERYPVPMQEDWFDEQPAMAPIREQSPSWSDYQPAPESAQDGESWSDYDRDVAADWSENQGTRAGTREASPACSHYEPAPAPVYEGSPRWSDSLSIASSRPDSPVSYAEFGNAGTNSVRPPGVVEAPPTSPLFASLSQAQSTPQKPTLGLEERLSSPGPRARVMPTAGSSSSLRAAPLSAALSSSEAVPSPPQAVLSSSQAVKSSSQAVLSLQQAVHVTNVASAVLPAPVPVPLPLPVASPSLVDSAQKSAPAVALVRSAVSQPAPAQLISLKQHSAMPIGLQSSSVPSSSATVTPRTVSSQSTSDPASASQPQAKTFSYTKLSLLARQKELEERIARTKEQLARRSASSGGSASPTEASTPSPPASGVVSPAIRSAERTLGRVAPEDLRRSVLESTRKVTPQLDAQSAGGSSRDASESADSDGSDPLVCTPTASPAVERPSSSAVVAAVTRTTATATAVIHSSTSLDELAVSFITETIQTVKSPPLHSAILSEKMQLAAKQKRLERHIAESKILLAKLSAARTKEEKENILGILRERRRAMEEDMKPEPDNTKVATSVVQPLQPRQFAVPTAKIRWPETARDATILIISDDEDDEI